MYSTSASWANAIKASHPRAHKAELYFGDSSTPIYVNLRMQDFSITSDRRSDIRRTGSVTLADERILADLKADRPAVQGYGSEIKIYAGLAPIGPSGSEELVPLGVFQVDNLSWSEGDIEVRFDLQDRASILQRDTPAAPVSPGAGTSAKTFISSIVSSHVPDASITLSSAVTDFLFPSGTTYEADYLQIVHDVSALMNAESYFDVDGNFQLAPIPYVPSADYPGSEDWAVSVGELGTLISASRTLSRRETYNKVIVTGGPIPNGTGAFLEPLTVVALDENTSSPTYYLGAFGVNALKLGRQELVTYADLYGYASSVLADSVGLSKGLSFDMLMNPALHEGDVVLLKFLDDTEELHLVDSITYSTAWSSAITTRVQKSS